MGPENGQSVAMRTVQRVLLLLAVGAGFEVSASKGAGAAPAAAQAGVRSVAEIAEATRPSLVKITQAGREGEYGGGSGFVVREDGLIVTNRHVIGEARRLKVEGSDGRVHEVVAQNASMPNDIIFSDTLPLQQLRLRPRSLEQKLLPLKLKDQNLPTVHTHPRHLIQNALNK